MTDIPVAGTAILVRDGGHGPEVLMMQRPDHGSFAGAWVFPGGRIESVDLSDGADEIDDARRAAARETAEEVGLLIDADDLVPFSAWTPPVGIPKRIRTWFYLGRAADAALTLSAAEVVSAEWARPEDVLARHARGELTLYPPTWVTLHGLTGADDATALTASVQATGIRSFRTVVRRTEGAPAFVWEPDVAHDPAVAFDAPGVRHRLLTDELPWRYLVD
ncbi:NUDIX domain-containing protein [Microbacterium elymi]|uniref:NUDIX domain-containing protein n=1 Tax=Microbacterium elymi TaxID=2909587 RepID=A0ABY5NKJ0_9MICO|nr:MULTISPECIES: NUDIX domain-containing protein [Microbacterium]UUT35682.1 NUDIX domain-containing protein [Microbacterium elymi]